MNNNSAIAIEEVAFVGTIVVLSKENVYVAKLKASVV